MQDIARGSQATLRTNGEPRDMRALDAVQGRDAAVGATANALTATWTSPLRSSGDCLSLQGTAAGSSALRQGPASLLGLESPLAPRTMAPPERSRAVWSMRSRPAPGCIHAAVRDFAHRLLEPVRPTGRNVGLSQQLDQGEPRERVLRDREPVAQRAVSALTSPARGECATPR